MFGDVPEHIRKRHQNDVPSLGSLDDIVLPVAPVRYVEAEILTSMAPRDAVLDSSAKLDDLTNKALKFYDDLLSEPPATDDPKILSAQSDAARTIMTTQLRVDDSRLKKRTNDTLAELLKRMEQEDVRLMKVVS
jgi:hypothetical protein